MIYQVPTAPRLQRLVLTFTAVVAAVKVVPRPLDGEGGGPLADDFNCLAVLPFYLRIEVEVEVMCIGLVTYQLFTTHVLATT